MNTISNTTRPVISIEESYAIRPAYPCDTANVERGTPMKMVTGTKVAPVTAASDVVCGVAVVGNKAAGTDVTIQSIFGIIQQARAEGSGLVPGAFVSCIGMSGGLPDVSVTAAAGLAYAMVLVGGADEEEVTIGVLRAPVRIPA